MPLASAIVCERRHAGGPINAWREACLALGPEGFISPLAGARADSASHITQASAERGGRGITR